MKKLIYGASVVALVLSATLSFVSCDDYVQDQLTEIRNASSGNATLVQALETKLNNLDQELDTQIAGLRTELTGYADAIKADLSGDAQAMADDLYAYIDGQDSQLYNDLTELINNKYDQTWDYINRQDSALFHNVSGYIGEIADYLNGRIDSLSTEMAAYKLVVYGEFQNMKAYVDSLNGAMRGYVDGLDAATNARVDSIVGLLGQVEIQEANFAALAQMEMAEDGSIILGNELQDAIIATVNAYTKVQIDEMFYTKAQTDSMFAANSADILAEVNKINAATLNVVDSLVGIVSEKVEELETTVDELRIMVLRGIYLLQSEIDEIDGKVADLNTKVEELDAEVKKMKENAKKQITSVVLQGTYNNVFGSIRLPMGLNSMLLAGHYGQVINDVVLPKLDGVLTEDDYMLLRDGKKLDPFVQAGDKIRENAGFALVTINPNTANLDGVKFALVNSEEETNGFEVGAPIPYNEKLNFGWTRSEANGLYALPILTDSLNLHAVKPRIDLNDIKDVVKETVKGLPNKQFNLSNIARVVYENTQDILDASAIKATWTDADGESHSVYTNYNLAATAIKPLSFQFQGFDALADKIARKMSKLKLQTIDPIAFDIDFTIEVQFNPIDTLKIDKIYIVNNSDPSNPDTIPVEGMDAFVQKINANFVTAVNSQVQNLIDQIKTQSQNKVGKMEDEINGKINSYINKVNNYTSKFNDYVTRLQNKVLDYDFNHMLQPCLLIEDGKHFGRVSSNRYIPSYVKKGESDCVVLVPTTYTSELLAPAYYKFLAVTNVYNADGTQYEDYEGIASQCNYAENSANINVPFQFKEPVVLSLPKTGLTYEIVYQAVDFSGITVTDKYYIRYID